MRVALYLRRSTDDKRQADSIAAQHTLLTKYATDHGHLVVDDTSFSDNASGRTARREGFQRLITTVQNGAPFEAVLVRDVSRWGRFENVDESAFWEFYLSTHGVKVIYVEESFTDGDPYVAIQKMLRRFVAAEFSRDKARLIQFGQYRSAGAGFKIGGGTPFGMVRVLVQRDGTSIQTLRPGERKWIGDQRIKLAPGDDSEVAVVRRIFRLCARGLTVVQIAAYLNRGGIRTQKGRRWLAGVVRCILRNPAYIGVSRARFRPSQNFEQVRLVETPDAWPGIVPLATWRKAQRRLDEVQERSTPAGLVRDLKRQLKESGNDDSTGASDWEDYFAHGDPVLSLKSHAADVETARDQVVRALRSAFHVRCDDDVVDLDGLLTVGFKAAFPQRHNHAGIHWRFPFDGTEPQDVTIGIAFTPSGTVGCYFQIINSRFGRTNTGESSGVTPNRGKGRTYRTGKGAPGRSLTHVVHALKNHSLLRYSKIAPTLFYEIIKDLALVNAAGAARKLGWSPDSGILMYRRLKREGYTVPGLEKQQGRRLDVVCDDCGRARTMFVGTAIRYSARFPLCRPCADKRKANYATCPDCGKTRLLKSGEIKRLSNGAATRCRKCSARANLGKPRALLLMT